MQKSLINPLTTGQSLFLDLVRLIAAQVVVVAHLSEWLYWPFTKSDEVSKGLTYYFGYFIFKSELMGAYAVAFFFVLSGFLISKSIFKSHQTTGFNLNDYILSRVARLLPTLLFAIFLSLCFYFIIYTFGLFGLHNYNLPDSSVVFPRSSTDVKVSTTVATSLFLNGMIGIPGINLGTMNINGPLWSLAHEFWFYICAGFWAHGFFKQKKWSYFALIGFMLWQLIFGNFLWITGFALWILGAISAQIKWQQKHILPLVISSLVFFFLMLTMAHGSPMSLLIRVICGLSAFLIINTGLAVFRNSNIDSAHIRKGASYSFTLYAIHWPCIVLFVAFFGPQLSFWSPLLKAIIYSSLFIGINFLAYLISIWTEDVPRWRNLFFKLKASLK
jgi:peptidoglycan/LPS O-acetylase OafA/YrhL